MTILESASVVMEQKQKSSNSRNENKLIQQNAYSQ